MKRAALILFATLSIFIAPTAALAQTAVTYSDIQEQGIIFAGICQGSAPCACREIGACTLADLLQLLVNIGVFILGISGTLVLAIFIYGGFLWITSAGIPGRVEDGRKAMVGAVIGLFIIFGAYAAVTLIVSILRTGEAPTNDQQLEDVTGGSGVIQTQ